jgi:ribokinase
MTRVAVIGHVEWVDFLPLARFPRRGEVIHADGGLTRAGGGGGVAAAVLADLGAEVDFFCALGKDMAGRGALAQLEERGVRMHVAWREEPTRRAVTLLETGGERTIITIGERLEPRGSDALDWERLRGAKAVYFTAGDAGALEQARKAGVVVASPRARDVLGTGTGRLDALVFSEGDRDERAWAERAAPHTRLLVATEGERGGRWWGESQGRWSAAPLPGPPRDAYGAGDSFAAGFTLGLGRGDSIEEAAALGAQFGARAMTRVGAP